MLSLLFVCQARGRRARSGVRTGVTDPVRERVSKHLHPSDAPGCEPVTSSRGVCFHTSRRIVGVVPTHMDRNIGAMKWSAARKPCSHLYPSAGAGRPSGSTVTRGGARADCPRRSRARAAAESIVRAQGAQRRQLLMESQPPTFATATLSPVGATCQPRSVGKRPGRRRFARRPTESRGASWPYTANRAALRAP